VIPQKKTVAVIGGGVAGMSAACALAEAGFGVTLLERRPYLGGRASSYMQPGVGEVIDNCQHALFGCCTNLRGFYRRIGVEEKIHWTNAMTMIEPGGRRSALGSVALPAPLHGLPKLLTAHAFSFADKLSLARAFSAILRGKACDPQESLGVWLRRQRQSEGAMKRFWHLVIASALNADLEEISVVYAAMVIRGLFMNSSRAGAMGMSRVPLSTLYASVPQFLAERGGSVVLQAGVDAAEWNEQTAQWTLHARERVFPADFVIAALPFEAMGKLIAGLPAVASVDALAEKIRKNTHWPIASVHLWFDRAITDLEHAVLLDGTMHWMYNQSLLQGRPGHYIELVASAAQDFCTLNRKDAMDLVVKELGEYFPRVKEAKIEKFALVKEMRATFGVPPGIDAARPAQDAAPWPQFFLAGDWTATGWPSTMEGAARSGHLAAEALCRAAGVPRACVEADLAPQGLMRLLR
jgi:zeta-carotene desaturase